MPYNYLFDVEKNETFKNAIVIIDEAHNLPGFCMQ